MRMDLHCHTRRSFDAFTSQKELVAACVKLGIDVIAITEHDKIAKYDKELFDHHNITVIPGCEFTSDLGAHIIGLYVQKSLKKNCTAFEIIEHINLEDGLILIPHPFKPCSGVCILYQDYSAILKKSHLIEMYNGGYQNSEDQLKEIIKFVEVHGLQCVASSDSHKQNQIGYYVTSLNNGDKSNLKDSIKSGLLEMSVNAAFREKPRNINVVQSTKAYQKVIQLFPYIIKRTIKIVLYQLFHNTIISNPIYKKIE